MRDAATHVPLIGRPARSSDVCERDLRLGREDAIAREGLGQQRREVHVGLHAVTDEGGHRDAAVLDLSVAEPGDALLVEIVADLQRVPVAHHRVLLDRELLETCSR